MAEDSIGLASHKEEKLHSCTVYVKLEAILFAETNELLAVSLKLLPKLSKIVIDRDKKEKLPNLHQSAIAGGKKIAYMEEEEK